MSRFSGPQPGTKVRNKGVMRAHKERLREEAAERQANVDPKNTRQYRRVQQAVAEGRIDPPELAEVAQDMAERFA